MKFDFLGLKTLTVLGPCRSAASRSGAVEIDLSADTSG